MRNFNLTLIILFFTLYHFYDLHAQVPSEMTYQAVVRDADDDLLTEKAIGVKVSVLEGGQSGTSIYTEEHDAMTNANGLLTLVIGQGENSSGALENIDWSLDKHFIKVELDTKGGDDYSMSIIQQVMSVPYARIAQDVVNRNDADADPTNELQELTLDNNILSLSDGNSVNLNPYINTDQQTLSYNPSTGDLTITGGNSIVLPISSGGDNWGSQVVMTDATLQGDGTGGNLLSVNGDLTDDQQLSISGNSLEISNGNAIDLTPYINTDQQTLSYNPSTGDLTISNGNSIVLPTSTGGDNWGSQSTVTDATLQGDGTNGNPLSVNGDLTDDQQLILAGDSLSISNGNTIILPGSGSPWNIDQLTQDIYYDNGNATVKDDVQEITITPDSIAGTISMSEEKFVLSRGGLKLQEIYPGSTTYNNVSRDSIYMYNQYGLLYPTFSNLQSHKLNFGFVGEESELSSHRLLFYDEEIGNRVERVDIARDSIVLRSQNGSKGVTLGNKYEEGGFLKLYSEDEFNLVHLGNDPYSNFLGFTPSGTLILNDHIGVSRASLTASGSKGLLYVHSDDAYAQAFDGGFNAGLLLGGSGDFQLLAPKINLTVNDKDAGFLTLNGGSTSDNNNIVYIGSNPYQNEGENGFIGLSNEEDDIESVSIFADPFSGGVLSINDRNGVSQLGLYSDSYGGILSVSDDLGFEKLSIKIDDNLSPEVNMVDGQISLVNNENHNEELNINNNLIEFYGDDQNKLITMGRNSSSSRLEMYGPQGNKNIVLGSSGFNHGYGRISLLDDNGDESVLLDGFGQVVGKTMSINNDFDNSSVLISESGSSAAGFIMLRNGYNENNVVLDGGVNGRNGRISVYDEQGDIKAGISIDENNGQATVFGDVKNFRMDYPGKEGKEIWYASLEGPEAAAYSRGTATLENGEVYVPFTEHFVEVVNHESVTIQLTPRHWDTYGIAIKSIDKHGFVVKELKNAKGNFDFDWEVKGVRIGFEDFEVVRSKK